MFSQTKSQHYCVVLKLTRISLPLPALRLGDGRGTKGVGLPKVQNTKPLNRWSFEICIFSLPPPALRLGDGRGTKGVGLFFNAD